jgi:hypothetical protein
MKTRKHSTQKSYRRQLQLESLETRCLLALTAFTSVDAIVACQPPASDSDTVIVARAMPVDDAEIISDCDCPPDASLEVYSELAADSELLELVVDDAYPVIDLTFVADDPSHYIFDITMVERTLADKVDPAEETTPVAIEDALIFAVEPQVDVVDVADEVSEDSDTGEESTEDSEIKSPIIYYTGPIVESTVEPEAKPTEADGSSGPIVFRPTYENSGFEVPQDGQEVPGIYTLGVDVTTTNDSTSTASNTDSDVGDAEPPVRLTRQQRRELREERRAERRAERQAERDRERQERLLALENKRLAKLAAKTAKAMSDDNETTDEDAKPLGGELESAVTSTLKSKHRGRKSGGR